MYAYETRVRYSELSADGKMSLTALLDCFQDCATFHTQSVGLSPAVLRQRGLVWVLSSWQVLINRLPELGETVRVSTYPYIIRSFLGFRNFTLETLAGERLATANSEWTMVNPDTGRPTRVPEYIAPLYRLDARLEMPYAGRKILLPDTPPEADAPIPVNRHLLDTNGHVNNAQYVRLACDQLPPDFVFSQLRVEYKRPALPGDVLNPVRYCAGDAVTVSLNGNDAAPYVLLAFEPHP